MNENKILISYILPVYQAESFIYENLRRFSEYCSESGLASEIIAVNDGSTDRTNEKIEAYVRENRDSTFIKYINLQKNKGKGLAIKKGIEAAEGEYIVFTDCDLQYSFENIKSLVSALIKDGRKVVLANRMHKDSIYKIRSENLTYIYVRHTAGRIYNLLINTLTGLHLEDTQAGLKGFDITTAKLLFNKMTVSGFAFDVEILVCASENNIKIVSVPIVFNLDEEMTTVNFIKQIVVMTFDLLRIFIKHLSGYYRK